MPKLTIDSRTVEVPAGTKVIEAAERLGIVIPRFCYHEALGSVGACRMCAVKFLEGPFKGVQMSCMVDVQDGMVVSTTDPEAIEFRKFVIECLMLNHPHDCPVCDEGGQCLLQDETVSGGHGIRRYSGRKRTYRDQCLGPFIAHEMNRCIHCYRCSRFYQDFSGYRDLGPMQSANRIYFGRFNDGALESPFSGNLVDICPTGVYTDKPARFKARRWDLQRVPSLCIHCSLGCNTVGNARYREMVRVEARFSGTVNGHFICDRGRFGFAYANREDRPRLARVDGQTAQMIEAVRVASERLKRITLEAGHDAIACLGSPRSSIETQYALKRLCRQQLWRDPSYFVNAEEEAKAGRAVSRLKSSLAVSMREIEGADLILAVGVDPVNEAPMLALAMRQAFRKGARVVVVDPRPVSLPFAFDHVPVRLGEMEEILHLMAIGDSGQDRRGTGPRTAPWGDEAIAEVPYATRSFTGDIRLLTARLAASRNPVVVCGTDIAGPGLPDLAADCAGHLAQRTGRCGLFFVLASPNTFGAALFSSTSAWTFSGVVEAMEAGKVKALIVVENDPFFDYPDQERIVRAIQKLEFFVVLDCLPSKLAALAHVFLPTTTVFESSSTFINQEGRLQRAERVHLSGSPVLETGGGSHPPRVYGLGIPGSQPMDAREILGMIGSALSPSPDADPENPFATIAAENPYFSHLSDLPYRSEGVRIVAPCGREEEHSHWNGPLGNEGAEDLFDLLLVDWTFGTEVYSSFSEACRGIEEEPCLTMHREDAAGVFVDGDMVRLHAETGCLDVKLKLSSNMARKTLVLPRHRRLAWQRFPGRRVKVPFDRIERL